VEKRLAQEIVDNLNTGTIVLDCEGRVAGINPAGEDLLGVSRHRARGRTLLELVGDNRQLADLVGRVRATGLTFADELTLAPTEVHPEHRTVDCRVSPMQGEACRDCLLVEMIDVTRRSRISRENALIMQHGAGRQMIRQLAHEIKNPLGGLRGAAQLLARQLASVELREYTNVIISEADRLAALVDTLLGPGGPPNKQPVNVHELTEYVLKLVEPSLRPGIVVRRDYDPGLPVIDLDRDQMVQAVLNLVQNALAALDGHGTLTLRTRATTNFTIGEVRHRAIASIEIEDDGPGIPPELQDSIFYPLVTGRPDGTGLGLPVAQDLVARHGGLIEFESRPGKTVFFVRIPLGNGAVDAA
jgi:two-component system nitrogen regulation sensor histidine kinase GlnL